VVFIPDLVSDLLRNPEYKSDRVHLNAAGYRAMAQEIYAVLKKHGAVE
jgi:lysophospholipase L1-like esterase